jgi:hypothetical protein
LERNSSKTNDKPVEAIEKALVRLTFALATEYGLSRLRNRDCKTLRS